MDVVDRTSKLEIMQGNQALADQKNNRHEPPQHIENGVVLCVDCDDPVSKKRLAARPRAARCIGCQTASEHKNKTGIR